MTVSLGRYCVSVIFLVNFEESYESNEGEETEDCHVGDILGVRCCCEQC